MSESHKKSKSVPAVLVAAVAALAIAGCSENRQVRRCVDDQDTLLDDSACTGTSGGYIGHGYPRWVYGGTSDNRIGSKVVGFSSTPQSGATVVSRTGQVISRGGFGSSGRGSFGG
ncbi:MAG TPA: hypothetical protein VEX38_06230 [Fimbriimonadaceae bacterium]|nr:hypothetical protein [Fimbriimonadaceae bacterium]